MGRLPVLMYHNIVESESLSKELSISKNRLEKQFEYLAKNNFKTYHFSELKDLMTKKLPIAKKSVVITFDDVYFSQLNFAYPLLQRFNLKACMYIPFAYVDKMDDWNTGKEKIMSLEQLKFMDSNLIELGWHSFAHDNYRDMSIEVSRDDLQKSRKYIVENEVDISNVMAYPYGKYPRKDPKKGEFFDLLRAENISFGLRIGNRVNSFPFKNNYEVQRIDIKGEDSLTKFKLKLQFGRLKPF